MVESYPIAPIDWPDPEEHRRKLAETVNGAMRGKTNNTLSITLAAGAATTVVTDERITANSCIPLAPLTANAAGALATTYWSALANGTGTLTHANNAQADRTFCAAIIG